MMSCLDVNDVFEELIEENKRLNKELIFANRLLEILLEMKYNLMNKFKEFDNYEYAVFLKGDITKYIKLGEQFNNLCEENSVVVNNELIQSEEQNKLKVDKETSTEFLNFGEEVKQIRNNQMVEELSEENKEDDIEQQTDNLGEQQLELHDNQIGEQNYQMDNENEEKDEDQSSYLAIDDGDIENQMTEHDQKNKIDEQQFSLVKLKHNREYLMPFEHMFRYVFF